MITAIILSHYKQRQSNLKRIIDDLLMGTVAPEKIIIFIDNPEINFKDDRVTIIRSSTSFKPNIRFALATAMETDYCFFLDDDLSVRSKTLENFVEYSKLFPTAILGLEGSILGHTNTPYSDDTCINRGVSPITEVDVIIRTYFCPTSALMAGLQLRAVFSDLPRVSLDDVFLCLGNKYLNNESNYVIPVDDESDLTELNDGGVGQSYSGEHYQNRNIVCKFFQERYK